MLEVLSEYIEAANSVFEENPTLRLEKLLENHCNITSGEITQLSVRLKKQWNNFAKYGLEICIVLTEEECDGESLVYKYDFSDDIAEIIKGSYKSSKIYYLNCRYEVIQIANSEERLTIEQCSIFSKKIKKVVLHLGMGGIDIFADGTLFSADNFYSSYKDLMDAEMMLSIYNYEKLIKGFYEQEIQYDINKRYFLRKDDLPKEYHAETIDKYPKLLRNKPEEYFEIDFVKYLKNNCSDAVIKEYITASGDRYDVLVLNEDNQVHIFEIKWLGRSITTGMKVFENYNNTDRAISGAYQLLDYVSNADKYQKYFLEFPVYCAVLLIFDAREEDTDIDYPKDLMIPNIDLSKRLFMEKKKISASNVHHGKRR